jgi:hypothetical protein
MRKKNEYKSLPSVLNVLFLLPNNIDLPSKVNMERRQHRQRRQRRQ